MAEVIFNYEGAEIKIQCNINDKMENIIKKFLLKTDNKETNSNLLYLYGGNNIKQELTFKEQANELDKKRNKMNILVNKLNENINNPNEIISKDIICPICKESTFINIKNFRFSLHGCKNNHRIDDIQLNEYEETQKIDISKIVCELCYKNNKSNTYNNFFYICNTCNKNICPSCKLSHDPSHSIINYDDKNYICKKHNEAFIKYCKKCNENICIICEKEHKEHKSRNIFELVNILINKEELIKIKEELKNIFDIFKSKIKKKVIYERINNKLEIYYKIIDNIIKNYNINKRNYHILQNLEYLKNYNETLIKDLTDIIKKNDNYEIYEFVFNNFYSNNEEKYVGKKKNNVKDGEGLLFYNKDDKHNRKYYQGDFKNDKKEGKGIMLWIDGTRYEGDWKNDKAEGKGIMYFNDGNKYEGYFKNNRREGKGIDYFNNGDKYEGDYKNDKAEGKGIMYLNNGDKYEGYWKNDKKEGKGVFYYNKQDEFKRQLYDGYWKNGKREGKGAMFWINYDVYKGDWKNDKIEGKGIMFFPNGDRYEGEWVNGKRTGKGTYYFANGNKKEGFWENDKFLGEE